MGWRDNFNQALRELLGGSKKNNSDITESKTAAAAINTDNEQRLSSGEQISEDSLPDISEYYDKILEETIHEYKTSPDNIPDEVLADRLASAVGGEKKADPDKWPSYFDRPDIDRQLTPEPSEMTIISKNTMVFGSIKSLASITIEGKVQGNVDVLKDASVRGVVIGDLVCESSDMKGSSIQGNVVANKNVLIYDNAILLGDLTAQYSIIDGKVKGDIDIAGKIRLNSNAVVSGDINTNTIAIEEGANIKGFVNTSFFDEHGDMAFPDQIE
jgi:cytoskeletal protein CcmA (bactofilin family)